MLPGLIHATAVSVNGEGVLLMGRSGSGKSDLALRLIDRGAVLVSDDGVVIDVSGQSPTIHTAPNIAGLIEMHGVGIIKHPYTDGVPLRLVVILDETPERFPKTGDTKTIQGYEVVFLALSAFEASAPLKVEQALRMIAEHHDR